MYEDPENVIELIEKLKSFPTLKEVKEFIDQTYPTWIINMLNSYSKDYSSLQSNWNKICEIQNIKPAAIIIVDTVDVFASNHRLIRNLSELLTRAGFIVRMQYEIIPCTVCNLALPSEEVYNHMKKTMAPPFLLFGAINVQLVNIFPPINKMVQIYCGNNAADNRLTNGSAILGSRYRCMQKGVGKGLRLPWDSSYGDPYNAIDDTKVYCGNNNILPGGYDQFGNLPQCLQKGVGIGKKIRYDKGPPPSWKWYIILSVLLSMAVFMILYFTKPGIISQKNKDQKKVIVWKKFILLYSGIITGIFLTALGTRKIF